jgi:hypothetical protein
MLGELNGSFNVKKRVPASAACLVVTAALGSSHSPVNRLSAAAAAAAAAAARVSSRKQCALGGATPSGASGTSSPCGILHLVCADAGNVTDGYINQTDVGHAAQLSTTCSHSSTSPCWMSPISRNQLQSGTAGTPAGRMSPVIQP